MFLEYSTKPFLSEVTLTENNLMEVKIVFGPSGTASLTKSCKTFTIDKCLPKDKPKFLFHKPTYAPVLFWGNNIWYGID